MSSPEINIIPEDMPLENRPHEKDKEDIAELWQQWLDGDAELNAWEEDFCESLYLAIEEERPWTQAQATKFDELKEKYLDA